MKYITIVGDGMADDPLPELSGATPLSHARTPNMDSLASKGSCGMTRHFYDDLPLDSGVANLSILGYDPVKYYPGRGPLEAINIGVPLDEGDIACRFNFSTVKDGVLVDPFAGHITNEETKTLIKALDDDNHYDGVEFHQGTSYRNLLILRGGYGHCMDFYSTPAHDLTGEKIGQHIISPTTDEGRETADMLNDIVGRSRELLEGHEINLSRQAGGQNPGNIIWPWGQGLKSHIPSFTDIYGLSGALISAVDLLKGIGREIGLDVIDVPGATGYIDTNYVGKADAALKSLREKDFVFVHVESPDESGHEGSIENKVRSIEDIDEHIVGRIVSGLDCDFRLVITPDHPTPVKKRTHTNEQVPFILYDSTDGRADGVKEYTEQEVMSKGSLSLERGFDLMKLLTRPS
ncbi:cofactor-independent phosphoglycerate mutase [Candidatus Altiarchaeota archaeon]